MKRDKIPIGGTIGVLSPGILATHYKSDRLYAPYRDRNRSEHPAKDPADRKEKTEHQLQGSAPKKKSPANS